MEGEDEQKHNAQAMDPGSQLQNVSTKPPIFMEENVQAWFSIMEAQFNLQRITVSTTKFYHTLAGLPSSVVGKILQTVLRGLKYEELKEAMLAIVR